MQQVTSDIMTFRGSHFELGVKTGKWLQQTPLLKIEKRMEKRVPRFDIDVNETYQIFQTYAPQIWEELMGLQKYTQNANTPNITLNFGHYRFTDLKESGCTVFQGKDFMVRNYDYHPPATYDGRYLLYQPTDSGFRLKLVPVSRGN